MEQTKTRKGVVCILPNLRPKGPDMVRFLEHEIVHELNGPCASKKLKCNDYSVKTGRKGNGLQKF